MAKPLTRNTSTGERPSRQARRARANDERVTQHGPLCRRASRVGGKKLVDRLSTKAEDGSASGVAIALANDTGACLALAAYSLAASAYAKHANVGHANPPDTARTLALPEYSVFTHA